MLTPRSDGFSKARCFSGAAVAALGVVLGLASVGCGDSAPDGLPVDDFVGAWTYSQATGSAACPNSDPIDETPSGNKTFARGVSDPLVDLTPLTLDRTIVCDFGYTIDATGTIATAVPGRTCALRGGDLFTVTSWTFSLLSPTTAEEVAHADISVTLPSQATTICTYTMMAHLTRVSKD